MQIMFHHNGIWKNLMDTPRLKIFRGNFSGRKVIWDADMIFTSFHLPD